jgi:adenylate cyclase
VHAQLFEWWGSAPADLEEADRASRIAMELNPGLADAHVARGFAMSLHRRYDLAEKHFEAATRINPQLYDAWYLHGRSCFARGQVERSAELFGKAAAARPDDFQSCYLQGQSLRNIGRRDEGVAVNQESMRRAERILALNPRDVRVLSLGAGAWQVIGDFARSLEWTNRALAIDPEDMSALINGALMHAKAGNKEEAMGLLERAFGLGWGKRDWIERDPDYDSLRDDPRFQALLARLQ